MVQLVHEARSAYECHEEKSPLNDTWKQLQYTVFFCLRAQTTQSRLVKNRTLHGVIITQDITVVIRGVINSSYDQARI